MLIKEFTRVENLQDALNFTTNYNESGFLSIIIKGGNEYDMKAKNTPFRSTTIDGEKNK